VPDWWRALPQLAPVERIDNVMNQWEMVAGVHLKNTISYMREHLQDVELMSVHSMLYLLYSIKDRLGDMVYWVSGNPLAPYDNLGFAASNLDWSRVPEALRMFYQFNDGFFSFTGREGFPPASQILCLGDYDLGIITAHNLDVKVNLPQTYSFYTNNSGGYIAVDLSDCEGDKAVVWWDEIDPTYDQDFWHVADDWTVLMFDY